MTKIRETQLSEPAGLGQSQRVQATRIRELGEGEAVPEGAQVLPENDTSIPGNWQAVASLRIGNTNVPH